MKHNLFNLKMYMPLNIQLFADGDPETPVQNPSEPNSTEPNSSQQPSNESGVTLSLETVQGWLNEQEEGKKWLQSFTDSRVTDAIKTYETKTLPKKVEDEIAKRYPPESEEAKQLRELKAQFEQSQKEAAREKLLNQALATATEKNLPIKLVDFFVGDDADKTTANLSVLEAEFNAAVQAEVERRFKDGGTTPPPKGNSATPLTREAVAKMSAEEINSRWDEIVKSNLL
ncbi:DUF4355 domain-containing protein [Lysinibacillus halotolerans]